MSTFAGRVRPDSLSRSRLRPDCVLKRTIECVGGGGGAGGCRGQLLRYVADRYVKLILLILFYFIGLVFSLSIKRLVQLRRVTRVRYEKNSTAHFVRHFIRFAISWQLMKRMKDSAGLEADWRHLSIQISSTTGHATELDIISFVICPHSCLHWTQPQIVVPRMDQI